MIHLYCGDGKGKTTAAMGLALRMAGRNKQVIIAQFMKGSDSGERAALAQLPQVILLEVPEQVKFSFLLTPEEHACEQARCREMLHTISAAINPEVGLLVLDEVCDAVNADLLPLEELLACLDSCSAEVVLTGRNPALQLQCRADYITHFVKERHPFDQGIPARPGVEF